MIRILLSRDQLQFEQNIEYENNQKRLIALNLDYLWRCILFIQETVLAQNKIAIQEVARILENEYAQKYERVTNELDMKNKLLDQIKREFSIEYSLLNKKLENSVQEKQRINQIAEDRYFELKCVRNEVDIIALKTYVRDLDKNLLLAMNEKKPQMDACQKLINIMKRVIPSKKKEVEAAPRKLRFKKRRKNDQQDETQGENQEDVIIFGSKGIQDTAAIDELLEYLYEQYSELFVITGEVKDRIMLEKEQVLKVIDDIPEEMLERCMKPPEIDKSHVEVQTLMTMNP